MKGSVTLLAAFCLLLALSPPVLAENVDNHAPVVSNVTASQRADGSNVVDVYYDLDDADGDACTVWIKVSNDGGGTWGVAAFSLSGDAGERRAPGGGKHIAWDVANDAPGLLGSSFKVRVVADDGHFLAPMCFVSAGIFKCSTGSEVFLSTYWIDQYEVTNELWCMFLNSGGKDAYYRQSADIVKLGDPGAYTYRPKEGYDRRPVRYVTWHDAVAFCEWRSQAEGLPAGTYALPTEAQWEKAAGWTPTRTSLWKYAIQSDSISCDTVNYNNCVGHATDVGSYEGHNSYYGCYDMSGNVWEWCADWWADGAYPTSTSDPTGPASGTYRVLRGGGWSNSATVVEVGCRTGDAPSGVSNVSGFRCARTLE